VSRYGIIPMASSLDTVGIISKKVSKAKEIFSIISEKDHRDLLTLIEKKSKFRSNKKVAFIK
jgi:aspartyl-tRNA(Asn)/glutamyl-tRNA(Gln) amidotransferase subunit A